MFEKLTTEEFIRKARAIHGGRYDYSRVRYSSTTTPVEIICPFHGPFHVTPNRHLSQNRGCPVCAKMEHNRKLRRLHAPGPGEAETEIAALRRSMDLSQAEFAERFHLNVRTLRTWEGKTQNGCPAHILWMIKRIIKLEKILDSHTGSVES